MTSNHAFTISRSSIANNNTHHVINVALKPDPLENDVEQALDEVFASIAKARREKARIANELEQNNTYKYVLLEIGAEAFEITKAYLAMIIHSISPIQEYCSVLISRRKSTYPQPGGSDDPRIAQLLDELAKLKEELKVLTDCNENGKKKETNSLKTDHLSEPISSSSSDTSLSYSSKDLRKQTASTPGNYPQKQLPFDASMLSSARLKKTPTRGSALVSPLKKSGGMQEALQKALEEKFKNVRPSLAEEETSFNQEEFECSSFILEKETINQEIENIIMKKPPIPPRPSKRSFKQQEIITSTKPVLANKN